MPEQLTRFPRLWAVLAPLSLALSGCGGVLITPDQSLPAALIKPLPVKAGLILVGELKNYRHKETRTGSDWEVNLGPGHVHLLNDMFKASFEGVEVFPSLEAARAASGLAAHFQPRIEQFSFATARDTGGRYWAVTIRYRLEVYTPQGEHADSLTLSGYGSTLAGGRGGSALERASLSAMRDAAAKFLVQLPRQPLGIAMAKGEAVAPAAPVSAAAASEGIEAVPIEPGEGEAVTSVPPQI